MAAPMYNVFVGSEIGLLKGINVCKSQWENINPIESAKKENEICALCWGNDEQTEVCFGLKCQKVITYDTVSKEMSEEKDFHVDDGKLKGIYKIDDNFVTASSSGIVRLWKQYDDYLEIQAGKDLYCMTQNLSNPYTLATGGKENDLKTWNWEEPGKPIFQAKNVRNDWLNLRVPVWVLQARFLPESDKLITTTGYHQIRVYDPKAQRRPVLDMTFGENPITALSVCGRKDNQVLIGNSQGQMALMDLRKGSLVQQYKGFAGGIRCIQCHDALPLVASCGLDRFLRIHDLNSKQLLYKFYLKTRLNCLLFSKEWEDSSKTESSIKGGKNNKNTKEDIDEEEGENEEEHIWDQMEIVKTRTKRKGELNTNENFCDVKKTKKSGNKPAEKPVKRLKKKQR